LTVGEPVVFAGITDPTGVTNGGRFFVLTTDTQTTFTVAATVGGTVIAATGTITSATVSAVASDTVTFPFDVLASELETGLQSLPQIGSGNLTASENSDGFTLVFTGIKSFLAMPAISVFSQLQTAPAQIGSMPFNTFPAFDFLDGRDSLGLVFEVEITGASGVTTIISNACTVSGDVIEGNQAGPIPNINAGAESVVYDNSASGLTSTNLQSSTDELVAKINAKVASVSAGNGIAVTGTTAATVALTTSAQASLSLANTALQQAGGMVTGNITLIGSANTASSQGFGANNLLTGSLGDARYGNLTVVSKPSDTTLVTDGYANDPHLSFSWIAGGVYQVSIYAKIDCATGLAVGGSVVNFAQITGFHNLAEYNQAVNIRMASQNLGIISIAGVTFIYHADVLFAPTVAGSGAVQFGFSTGAIIRAGATLIARKIA